jgi:chromosome partitioning protein
MSEPDDAAWMSAATGAPRSDDGPAAHGGFTVVAVEDTAPHQDTPEPAADVLSDVADDAVVDAAGQHGSDAEVPGEDAAGRDAVSHDAVGQDAANQDAAAGGLWAEPAPPNGGADSPGAGGSSSPAIRAMRGRDPEPAPLTHHGPAMVLALCNQKGGVGKTTSTINLGAALAEYGRRVLLVDLDPQGALSAGLGIASHELEHTIYNLMLSSGTAITDVLMPTGVEGVDLIPANIDLSAGEVQLINEVGREHTLARALRPVLHAYDYILIDCQPSLGLLTINALACSHGVIIPLAAEYFSLRGVHLLVDTISKVKERINPNLSVEGVLVTMYDGRTVHAREVVGMLHQRFGDTVFDTVISRTVKFPETTVAGEPITSYAPSSPAAQAYRALAREVIAR